MFERKRISRRNRVRVQPPMKIGGGMPLGLRERRKRVQPRRRCQRRKRSTRRRRR